jgi:hypothetical protein
LTRRFRLALALLAGAAAAGIGVLVFASGGSSGSAEETAAELYARQLQVGTFDKYVKGSDPDELDRSSVDVTTTVRSLGKGRYELVVQNFSNIGFINSFTWSAPDMEITSVASRSGGSCRLLSSTSLTCAGLSIRPPKCTCEAGGHATIRFDARELVTGRRRSYGVSASKLTLGELTPVPYHIPSYKGAEQNVVDLPLCARGERSTEAHRCIHGG